MKARTAKERAVETATAQYIRPLTPELVREFKQEARPHYFVRIPLNRRERGVWCANCGGTIEYNPDLLVNLIEDKRQTVTCPHCVFDNGYYEHPDSLLLSARDTEGHRLETIEFNLSSGKVEQSRAVCNGTSPKHKQILAMMKDAADQITETWKRSQAERPKIEIKPVQELVRAFV